jgi:hypothetical protein
MPSRDRADTGEQAKAWMAFKDCMESMEHDVPSFRFQVTPSRLDTYWFYLQNYDADVIRAAFKKAIGECERLAPTPAQIKDHARALHKEKYKDTRPPVEEPVRKFTQKEEEDLKAMLENLRRKCRASTSENNWNGQCESK